MASSVALLFLPRRESAADELDANPVTILTQDPAGLRLAASIDCALRATGYGSLRDVKVSVHGGMVHLSGRVPSYYLKQIAQTTALSVPGVNQVQNELEVFTIKVRA